MVAALEEGRGEARYAHLEWTIRITRSDILEGGHGHRRRPVRSRPRRLRHCRSAPQKNSTKILTK
jgi:hypothetical protein